MRPSSVSVLWSEVTIRFQTLVIDGHALFRQAAVQALIERGHVSVEAESLADAGLYKTLPIDVVLISMEMMKDNSVATCEWFRQVWPSVCIVLSIENELESTIALPNVDDFFVKTNDISLLTWRIERAQKATLQQALLGLHQERQIRLEQGIAEQKRQILGLQTRLSRVSEAQDACMALLSHDIRSPVAVVLGNCQLLEEGIIKPQQYPRTFETMRRQIDRMSQMVERQLERYRQQQMGAHGRCILGEVLAMLVSSFRTQTALRKQTIILDLQEDIVLETDVSALRELLYLCLDTALRNQPEGSTLPISLHLWGDHAQLQIVGGADLATLPRYQSLADLLGGTVSLVGGVLLLNLPRRGTAGQIVLACQDLDYLEQLTETLSPRWQLSTLLEGVESLQSVVLPDVLVMEEHFPQALEVIARLKAHPKLGAIPILYLAATPIAAQAAIQAGATLVHLGLYHPQTLQIQIQWLQQKKQIAERSLLGHPLDVLCGVELPAFLDMQLAPKIQYHSNQGLPLPIVVIWINCLENIRHSRGWATGDQLLIWLSALLKAHAHVGELIGRIADDCFVMIPSQRSIEAVQLLSETLGVEVQHARPRLCGARVTVSIRTDIVDATRSGPVAGLAARSKGETDGT